MRYHSVFAPRLFEGTVMVVTGGGSGIGRCTAHELAALGASVVLVGRDAAKLGPTRDEIIQDGGKAEAVPLDIREEDNVKAAITGIVQRHGRIDGLVNNA